MKIAVASDDGVGLSQHFGQSRIFLVFEVTDGQITGPEARSNSSATLTLGDCGIEPQGHHDHSHHGHDHSAMAAALKDCQVVLAGGMGRRAAMDLQAQGIEPLTVAFDGPALAAVQAYLAGSIKKLGAWCCNHH
jgi:predicted Fe-Mo cluster-binding NifX family protein